MTFFLRIEFLEPIFHPKNNQRNSWTFKIAGKHSFRNWRSILNPSPLTLHQASRCRRNVLNVCHRWSGSVGMGGVSQMPLHHNLGTNLSVQVQGGRQKFHSAKALRFDGHLSKQLGHLLLIGSEDSTLEKHLSTWGVPAANRGLKQRTMLHGNPSNLYICASIPRCGWKDPERATRTHIHTFAVCLIPSNKDV